MREHQLIGTHPALVRYAADKAVAALGYSGEYYVDADHIQLDTLDPFLETTDFFTLDVATHIGHPVACDSRADFYKRQLCALGEIQLCPTMEPQNFSGETGIYSGMERQGRE